jgi:hypothetical protein
MQTLYSESAVLNVHSPKTTNDKNMPKQNKRRKNNGKRQGRNIVSTVVTTLATVAGNVVSSKGLTIAQLIPDVSNSRNIILKKVVVQVMPSNTGYSSPGAMAQACLIGPPFVHDAEDTTGQGLYASQEYKALSTTLPTTLVVTATLPGQKTPVGLARSGNTLGVLAFSQLAGTWALTIRTHYTLLPDNSVTAYP